ncbi:MAG: preprotein translocase subunit SecG [Saprospiraceae bacterium]|jgi:preprotein translocase subunit SecG|uniref:preprotein translocase subunit SecG n=1 Tax=Candidatus Brachybacter algidus TaxID=2982024 RepID=UPI001B6EC4F7|nr:preprotein translocase subunit SecG [Candidatus Brachybacter algidus]MBP7306984.1 preprotein translocase subunit SecG [Saprospiraceae bacterium]MBK6372659.1 preprotein translocase subunit SecG [Candidatus Brachybacter algidus]MBK6448370.1 preprotein translocase subunit SecG [Candidatus Brachybacter algidus]MBK7603864.1 preprotein translocase subunit SecG [Candidatus Brachybacter algidus]MBK8604108.1 preprotein translocase subunit SecG [Candidatus Brachybacter algidus]
MIGFITVLIAIIGVLLMAVVLIQNPKGGGVDANFGGQAANQLFGASNSIDFVEKLTWVLAASLFALCMVAAIVVNSSGAAAGPALLSQ